MWIIIGLAITCFSACTGALTQPQSWEEYLPERNTRPESGIVIIQGSASAEAFVYEGSGLIKQWYIKGTNPAVEYNSRTRRRIILENLPMGHYTVEVYPFYYATKLIPPRRYVKHLRRRTYGITVDDDPQDYLVEGVYFGWVLNIDTGSIPHRDFQGPIFDFRY